MTVPSGIDAQMSFAEESTYGTPVTTTRFYEFVSEGLKMDLQRLESKGLRNGKRVQRSDRWATGRKTVGGPTRHELANKSFGLLFKHMFGAVASSGPVSSMYTHSFTPGDLSGKSLTGQVGRPDVSATPTVQPFTYEGLKVSDWEISCKEGEISELLINWVGEDEKNPSSSPAGQALDTAAYPSALTLLTFVQGTLTVGGSTMAARECTIKGDNGLKKDRYRVGSGTVREPSEANWRDYGGDISVDFDSLTAYNRFVAGTEAALVLVWSVTVSALTYTLTITCNVRFDGETPNIEGADITEQKLPFKCLDTGSGPGTAITLAYVTTDTTP